MPTPYVTMTDITGKIPGPFLTEALDDIGDGSEVSAVWSQIAQDVADEIDGILGARFPVPFTNPLPAVVVRAAKTLACSAIYKRRGKSGSGAGGNPNPNPFEKDAQGIIEQLTAMAKGEMELDPSLQRKLPSVSVITTPAKTSSATGQMAS